MRALRSGSLVLAVLLGSCVEESDNVTWYVVSNPSNGSGVQGGLVVSWRSSKRSLGVIRLGSGAEVAGEAVLLHVEEAGGPNGDEPTAVRELFLGVDNDCVLDATPTDATLHSPALPTGAMRLGRGAVDAAPDAATALRLRQTDGTVVRVARQGNLVAAERTAGVTVWRPGLPDQVFPPGSSVVAQGEDLLVVEPGGRRTLLFVPPAAAAGSQVRDEGGAMRFFAFDQSVSALLPGDRFTRLDGADGAILSGGFQAGAVAGVADPFRALLPNRNHHLLLLREPAR